MIETVKSLFGPSEKFSILTREQKLMKAQHARAKRSLGTLALIYPHNVDEWHIFQTADGEIHCCHFPNSWRK